MVTRRKMKTRVISASPRRPSSYPVSPVTKFFKLILPSTLNNKMMKIPPRFVKLYGSKLSKFVTFETPVGFKRSIQLKRIDEEIWFKEGWIEFAEAHSITEGHLLTFEFNGNSTFRVVIFDVTAAEIEYPFDEDSDVEIIEIIDNSYDSDHKPKKKTSDFHQILNDIDAMDSLEALEEDKRVFNGKQSF